MPRDWETTASDTAALRSSIRSTTSCGATIRPHRISRPDGYRSATLTSLTGSLLMLTDRPEVYRTDRVEAARRTAPVLLTMPGQVYDVDPSRSSRLFMVDHEVSGSGPASVRGGSATATVADQLDVARPFERWTVLARTAGAPDTVRLLDLGLAPGRDYVAFDFWGKRFLAPSGIRSSADRSIQRTGSRSFALRERQSHPQCWPPTATSAVAASTSSRRAERGTLAGVSRW